MANQGTVVCWLPGDLRAAEQHADEALFFQPLMGFSTSANDARPVSGGVDGLGSRALRHCKHVAFMLIVLVVCFAEAGGVASGAQEGRQ